MKITRDFPDEAFPTRSEEDRLFFKALFKQHVKGLYRLAMSQLKSAVEAEEIVQECFLKFWEQRRELGNDLIAAKGYLYTSAYNAILNQLRQQRYWVFQECTEDLAIGHEPQTTALEHEELENLYKVALEQLPPKRRQVFLMSRQQGLSYAAISKELDISTKSVEKHMGLALKFFRLYFQAHGITLSLLWGGLVTLDSLGL
ncbi:MAG: RNA polymerase sigma-70 factor [Janthinobacterium lividum]